jgi:DHA1 family tetracycline resistance protein-like MFS transporter
MNDTASSPRPDASVRSGKWFVFVAVFIDMVGIGIAFPVLPILVGNYTSSPAAQTHWAITLSVTYSLMQFLCAPMLGAISDRFGRRPVLIAAIIGLGIHYMMIATAQSLLVLLVARLMGGVTGASFSVANAYLADITRPEDRAKSFGLIGAAFGLGFICGPPLGGVLGGIDLHLPFYAAAGLSFVNALYGYFAVPESLPKERRSATVNWGKANPFRALTALVQHHSVGSLVIVFTLFSLAHMAMIQTWALYTHFRFGWGTRENGFLLFFVGLLSAVVQGGLMGRLVKLFGEERLALTAIGVNIFIQLGYGLAQAGWVMYPILFCSFLTFTASSAIQGVVSKSTNATEQGVTLGAMQSINSLAAVVGPLIAGQILAQVSALPPTDVRVGAHFFFCASLNLLAFLVAWRRLSRPVATATST